MKPNRVLVGGALVLLLALGGLLAWYLLSDPATGAETVRQATGGDRPNVILITIDTLRADHLGSYGSSDVRTPQIDRLAHEGVRFANAATTVPFTLPAHSSIMTGTYPPYHGMRENVGYTLGDEVPTLAETLSAAGYQTAGFVSAFVLDSRWGVGRGFDVYHDDFDLDSMDNRNMGSVQRDGADTLDAVVGWLDERSEDPFFLWVHLFDPHDPYTPPEPFASRYPGRPYQGEVAYTDSLIGDFRRELESRDLLESSMLVLTGDHGEGLGDHGEEYHGYFIYDSTAHVPLIIRAPGLDVERVVPDAVSHVDLLPTVLELAGVPVPDTAQGESLVPLLTSGRTTSPASERAVYTESYYAMLHYGWAPLRSLRTAQYKYIAAPKEELYLLDEDPREESNVARQRAATSLDLSRRLEDLTTSLAIGGSRETTTADLDEDTLRQLRALGYIAGRGAVEIGDSTVERADPKDKIELHQAIMASQGDIGHGAEDVAEARLRVVLARDPEILDANQMVGNILAERGSLQEALPFFQKALEIDPDHETSLFGLANAYQRLGRTDEALVGYERLLAINPTESKAVVAKADILVERADLAAASELLRNTVTAGDRVPPMLYNKYGELLVLQRRPLDAEGWFERAAEANVELAQPLFNLAVLREERVEIERAVELYEQAIERSASHFQARFNLGRLEGLRGNLARQVELYESALEANPEFSRGYFLLAKLLMDTGGDLQRAETLARDGLAHDPERQTGPLGYYVLADILSRQGRRQEAEQTARLGQQLQSR